MRIKMTRFFSLVLSASAIALLFALRTDPGSLPASAGIHPSPAPSSSGRGLLPPTANSPKDATIGPARIARLFALPPPPPAAEAKAEIKESPQPTRADWIVYLGYSTKAGTTSYFFKDTRGARVISLSPGERKDEWKLVDTGEDGFILQVGSSSYSVSSGR